MAQHTPGLWIADANEIAVIREDDGEYIPIAELISGPHTNTEQMVADGNLMAAALDMYEALKRVADVTALREAILMTGAHISHHHTCELIEEDRLGVRAAIAKAEGRKP